ncbi:MAG TPA: 4-hydroxy-3-methylbut-2-enyl diphosphate reductase [Elusimicrobia bacterium]|nr:MAG: 4-hydroxy-3-methylbut-2-enyl diphosphate reductase [Elusimicrobia bacterium GWF2_62_30]HBA60308.1 4-hydroxy-3-methylbut-2-enyl diphosphate reductase [Elusimicrobiota bacterium]
MPERVQITVAESAGFCPGVKTAIDKVLELAKHSKKRIYTLGPLIHNKQVIETLKEQNIHSVNSAEEIKERGAILVIRAHGITPEEEKKIRSLGLEVVDATCPLVKHAQENIRAHAAEGCATIIVGDRDHAEVVGLMGYAGGHGHVVSGPEEIKKLRHLKKANIVAQTTQENEVFLAAVEEARKIAGELTVSNTICNPTRQRQKETVELSRDADLVIVVGGRNSANTARLFHICKRLAKKAVHIEKEDELKKSMFRGAAKVFITAGASTPTWMIEKVLEKAHELAASRENRLLEQLSLGWKLVITGSLYTALAAAALTYVCLKLEGAPVSGKFLLMAGLFAFSLHMANRAAEKGAAAPDKARKLLFVKYAVQSRFAALLAGALAIFLSAALGWQVLLTAAFFWLVGMLYPYKLPIGFEKFGNFPASKDLLIALGWAFMCAYAPGLGHGGALSNSTQLAVFFAFLLVFTRSVLFGVSHAHSDMITGKENFYKAAGPTLTYLTLFFIFLLLSAVLLAIKGMGWQPELASLLLTGLFYYLGLLLFFYFSRIPERITAETLIDAQFFILAALAYYS